MMEREVSNIELTRKLFEVFIYGCFTSPDEDATTETNTIIAHLTCDLADALGIRREFDAMLVHHYDQAQAQIAEEDNE